LQRRFAHLFKPQRSEEAIREIQKQLDNNWNKFRKQVQCGIAQWSSDLVNGDFAVRRERRRQ
jgi:hypothetical protein